MHPLLAAPSACALSSELESHSGYHAAVEAAVARFPSISLDDVGPATLMERLDSKFLVPVHTIPDLLEQCAGQFRVLEVGGRRLCRYATTYLDTDDLAFFRAHQTGRLPRRKVRLRRYVETGARFLEVKVKTNKKRTMKTRVPLADGASLDELLPGLLNATSADGPLSTSIHVDYVRVTFVSTTRNERVTFDFALTLSFKGEILTYPGVSIIEVKRATRGSSWFLDAMRRQCVRAQRFSKYCVGVSALRAEATRSRDLRMLRLLNTVNDRSTHAR